MDYIEEKDRIYATDGAGRVVAEVTFPAANGLAVIDHTFVDESLRGQGIAGELVRMAADRILAEGNKIGATCSYAQIWLRRHPEYPVENFGPASCRL